MDITEAGTWRVRRSCWSFFSLGAAAIRAAAAGSALAAAPAATTASRARARAGSRPDARVTGSALRFGSAILVLICAGACDGSDPLPPLPPSTSTAVSPTPTIDTRPACHIPDGYTLIVHQCSPAEAASTCIAQDSPYAYVPPAELPTVTQIPIADCEVKGRPDIKCATACP